jgi:hypothetical protein
MVAVKNGFRQIVIILITPLTVAEAVFTGILYSGHHDVKNCSHNAGNLPLSANSTPALSHNTTSHQKSLANESAYPFTLFKLI